MYREVNYGMGRKYGDITEARKCREETMGKNRKGKDKNDVEKIRNFLGDENGSVER